MLIHLKIFNPSWQLHGAFLGSISVWRSLPFWCFYFLSSGCARVCVDTRRLHPLLSDSVFFPWGQDLWLNPKLGWWPASPNNSSASFTPAHPRPPYWGYNHSQPYLTFSVTSEDLNSGPHASTVHAATHWVIYPAPVFLSEKPIPLSPFLTTGAYSVSRSSQD